MFQYRSISSSAGYPFWQQKWGVFAAIYGALIRYCLVVVLSAVSSASAYGAEWHCGVGAMVERSQLAGNANVSVRLNLRVDDVDRIFDDRGAGTPYRLADIAFLPEDEKATLAWLRVAAKNMVEVTRLAENPDYLGRIPAIVRKVRQEKADAPNRAESWQHGLLSRGLAMLLPESDRDLSALIRAEDAAIAGRVGLWSRHQPETAYRFAANPAPHNPSTSDPPLPDVARAVGRFVLVEGVLVSVEHQEWRSYLNFGADWRRDFTIAMDRQQRDAFIAAGQDPVSWIGSYIRVRGIVENRGGPYIALRRPDWLCVARN